MIVLFSDLLIMFADTAPYLLQDELGEQKFKMSLESSLDHAKVTGKTLMKGHTFYLLFGAEENKVLINTLNAAAKSAGGAVSTFPFYLCEPVLTTNRFPLRCQV